MTIKLEDNGMCYVCGPNNPVGFRLEFSHPEPRKLQTSVVFSQQHQGFKGIVHGGMMAMILDEVMVNLAWKEGFSAVTAELRVRLKKPARIGEKIDFEGQIQPGEGRKLLQATATAKNDRGELLATAEATCVRLAVSEETRREILEPHSK